ncbi:MAG: NAD(P)H-dependent glycerol-3-phosphate dehydrogenase [Clostridiales Family XIII bacterium]|jgi:glycerol-3-phosphate dehydrogenase (NAD(P)+)|nr:NAD(P)H-dependent glycerol-3-phosphate dehydrogenase [Clostridiales Family XIII bacterium]
MTIGEQVCVIGAGSWGSALSNLLAGNGHDVNLWDRSAELLTEIQAAHENKKYLPGVPFASSIHTYAVLPDALSGADIVVFAVPAQRFGEVLAAALPHMKPESIMVNVAKGIEQKSLQTPSQLSRQITKERGARHPFAVLSGPSHAEEVGRGQPTTVVAASEDEVVAERIQDLFMNDRFRVYTGEDVLGLELGGALKNIIALGAGISDGMGFGDNTKAALMTRGIAEMTRLGVRMGATPATFAGLGGIGDLIVTCTSMHSRNRRCGILIGKGIPVADAVAQIGMVVEGIYTAQAAYELAQNCEIEMPISEVICKIIKGEATPEAALTTLMTRDRKQE